MKKLFLALFIVGLTHQATQAAEDLSSEAMFPNAAQGMKCVKASLIFNIQTQQPGRVYDILAASNEHTLRYLFADNPKLSQFISEFLAKYNRNLLHHACAKGDATLAKAIYNYDKGLIKKYDTFGKSPLYYALKYNNVEFVDYILELYDSLEEFVSQEDMAAIDQIPGSYFQNREFQNIFDTIK